MAEEAVGAGVLAGFFFAFFGAWAGGFLGVVAIGDEFSFRDHGEPLSPAMAIAGLLNWMGKLGRTPCAERAPLSGIVNDELVDVKLKDGYCLEIIPD